MGIPKLVENEDEIQFLIHVEFGRVRDKYTGVGDVDGKTRFHPSHYHAF